MQADEGLIRDFQDKQVPEGWLELTAGQIVKINDCYFRIINTDVAAQEVLLKPMPKAAALVEILKSQGIHEFKHQCDR